MSEIRSQVKRLLSDSAVYGLSDASAKIFMMAVMPFLTRLLSPAQFGMLDLLSVLAAFATPFVMLGFDFSLQSFYFDTVLFPNAQDRKRLVSSTFWTIIGWGALLVGLGILFAPLLDRLLFQQKLPLSLVKLGVIYTIASVLFWFSRYILRLEFRSRSLAVLSFTTVVINALLGLAVLKFSGGSLTAYYVVNIVIIGLGGVVGLFLIRRQIGFHIDLSAVRKSLEMGLPFMPTTIIFLVMTIVDRLILNRFVPLDQLGLYSVALKIVSGLQIAVGVFSTAWSPLATKTYFEQGSSYEEFYRRLLIYVLAGFGLLALGTTAFAPEILWALAPRPYWPAAVIVGPLALSVMALAANQVTTLGPVLKRKPVYGLILTAFAAALNIGLCWAFVPRWGISGAAWSLMLAQTFLTLGGLFITEHLLRPMRYDRSRSLLLSGLVIGLVASMPHISGLPVVTALVVKLILVAGFIGFLRLVGVLHKGFWVDLTAWFKQFPLQIKGIRAINN